MGFFVNSKDTRQGKVTWTVHQGSHQVIIKISPCDNFRSQANWPCLFHRLETDARIMVVEVVKKIVISLCIYILRFWCKKLFCGVFSWVKKVWIIYFLLLLIFRPAIRYCTGYILWHVWNKKKQKKNYNIAEVYSLL